MDRIFATSYWPSIASFSVFRPGDVWRLEKFENFQKQTSRTRCLICGANGIQQLVVPVTRNHTGATPICDVMLDLSSHWQHIHWQSIASAYGMSPFFEFYAPDIEPLYHIRPPFSLFDFNTLILKKSLELMDMDVKIDFTSSYEPVYPSEDYRQSEPAYAAPAYYQTFARKHGFVPGQCILDLLFNEGPECWRYLELESPS